MELLKIEHIDFILSIECTKFEGVWQKAKHNLGEENLTSTYTWTDGVVSIFRYGDEGQEIAINAQDPTASAIFFDHTDYPIWVEFKEGVRDARLGSVLQSENDHFTFHKKHRILSGFLNFGNDIGRSEITLLYRIDGIARRFVFGFEVLSTKLNYHDHWHRIIADIEAEYSMLSLDYMRRTFHGFSLDTEGNRPDLVWWSVFQAQQNKFLKAVRSIIDRPRRQLQGVAVYQRADKIRRVPASIENELAEHRYEQGHLYRVEQQTHSHDTLENRFLKYALDEIAKKYDTLKRRIESVKNSSESYLEDMEETKRTMLTLQRHPFFRSVGPFKGFTQESLVLQKATGYIDVYRTWTLLRRAYSLNDGIFRLQTKDIATLYEIWCFIEVSHIVKEKMGITADDIDHQNRMEMNGLFTWGLGKGEQSRILFKKDGVELAELVYNPKHTERENDSISIENLVVKTVAQRPDIVLQLVKDDIQKEMKITYLFDAKYRIDRNSNGLDYPPEDAINQMHRYRDAIYYKRDHDAQLKKEVVGGYILFPGSGEPLDVQTSSFYRSIKDVNIGAFPLRPNDERNRELLSDFINSLILNDSQSLITDSIPQKGLNYVIDGNGTDRDMAFVGYVRKPNNDSSEAYRTYYEAFEKNDHPTFYYSGKSLTSEIDLRTIRYVFPNIPGNGYYRVKRIYSEQRNKLFYDNEEHSDRSMRIVFELGEFVKLGDKSITMTAIGGEGIMRVANAGEFMPLKCIVRLFKKSKYI